MAITNPDVFFYRDLLDAIPGFIQQMDATHGTDQWHFIVLALQWSAGADAVSLSQARGGQAPGC